MKKYLLLICLFSELSFAQQLQTNPEEVNFGKVDRSEEKALIIKVKNIGQTDIKNIFIADDPSVEFEVYSRCSHLAPKETCELLAVFNSSMEGSFSGSFDVEWTGGVHTVPLKAVAIVPSVRLKLNRNKIRFMNVEPGHVGRKVLRLKNTGSNPAKSFWISDDPSAEFNVYSRGCSNLAPRAVCELLVEYSPTQEGRHEGIFQVEAEGVTLLNVEMTGRSSKR